jgi:hypothetical protein
MTEWMILAQRFQKLKEVTGRDKSSSYVLNVVFDPDDGILVEMGCHDVADWPRNIALGPFDFEEKALEATRAKVAEAEEAVKKQQEEDNEISDG